MSEAVVSPVQGALLPSWLARARIAHKGRIAPVGLGTRMRAPILHHPACCRGRSRALTCPSSITLVNSGQTVRPSAGTHAACARCGRICIGRPHRSAPMLLIATAGFGCWQARRALCSRTQRVPSPVAVRRGSVRSTPLTRRTSSRPLGACTATGLYETIFYAQHRAQCHTPVAKEGTSIGERFPH